MFSPIHDSPSTASGVRLLALLASLAVMSAPVPATAADDIAGIFTQLPASVFEEWVGEDPKPIADPANRSRLVAAKGDALNELALALSLRDPIVDVKNGFLRFDSNGDGEGAVFTMTYWKAADGSKLVGVAIEQWSNISNRTSHISFWRSRDGKLSDVSKEILPDLTLARFYDKHPEKVKAAEGENFRWWWKLPQKGTTIQIEAPALELYDEYADLAQPDHAYEGRWDGKAFKWVRVKAAKKEGL